MQICRHTLSAYDHWHCQRGRFHLGRHRFNNYTESRFPRFWKYDNWRRTLKANRRLRRYNDKPGATVRLMSHRRWLFPVKFEPVDARSLRVPREQPSVNV